jgi:hypothetical protein
VYYRKRSERGQQLVMAALLFPVLLGFVALAVDVGNAYLHRRRVQNAVDAAASAGALELCRRGGEVARTVARHYAAENGYTDNVAINLTSDTMRVRITDNVVPIFAKFVWAGTFDVAAQAAARCAETGLGPPVIVLEERQCRTLELVGTSQLIVSTGNVHVNSACANAVNMTGTASLTTESSTTIVGGVTRTSNTTLSPAPITGAPVLPDPLAHLPPPNPDNCTPAGIVCTVRSHSPLRITGTGSVVLYPGVYEGGVFIQGSGDVTLMPGVYIFAGGGISISGSSSVSGNGITFYVTEGSNGRMGDIDLSGTGDLMLTPPSTGTYAGVLIFQDRRNTEVAHISGTSMLAGSRGIVYIPNAELVLSGTGDGELNFVVKELTVTGNGILDVHGYTGPGYTTFVSTLVE